MSHTQVMPHSSAGIRAGCIRALARLAIRNGTAAYFSIDEAARFCDEVQRSSEDELGRSRVQDA